MGHPVVSERREKRLAYEVAKTLHRSFYERYYPVRSPGTPPAETVTPEAIAELERLAAATEAARLAWESAVSARNLTP